jgi:lysophospholipase L1-like esterase
MRKIRYVWPLLLVALTAAPVRPAAEHWVATWGRAQQLLRGEGMPGGGRAAQPPATPPTPPPATRGGGDRGRRFPAPPVPQALNNQTIRMVARVSLGGRRVRVRLSSAFNTNTVKIGAAHIALRSKDSGIAAGSDRVLTFGGKPTATLYAGGVLIGDPVSLDLPPLSDVAVSLYFPGDTGFPTVHYFGLHDTYISKEGDFTAQPAIPDATTTQSYYWLAGIDVVAPADAATLVAFGDSITDGDQSTPDTNGMWPAVLAARLQANKATAHIGVVNAGISGNQVLGDGGSGVVRLAHDALSHPGVKWIMLLEGINDISRGSRESPGRPLITADDLIAGYQQIIEMARLHGVQVIGCTITPYGGRSEYGESVRVAVNQWIRTSGAFYAVVDFDAATRSPDEPKRFRPEIDSPDGTHPANPGYKMMADSVDLSIFSKK